MRRSTSMSRHWRRHRPRSGSRSSSTPCEFPPRASRPSSPGARRGGQGADRSRRVLLPVPPTLHGVAVVRAPRVESHDVEAVEHAGAEEVPRTGSYLHPGAARAARVHEQGPDPPGGVAGRQSQHRDVGGGTGQLVVVQRELHGGALCPGGERLSREPVRPRRLHPVHAAGLGRAGALHGEGFVGAVAPGCRTSTVPRRPWPEPPMSVDAATAPATASTTPDTGRRRCMTSSPTRLARHPPVATRPGSNPHSGGDRRVHNGTATHSEASPRPCDHLGARTPTSQRIGASAAGDLPDLA